MVVLACGLLIIVGVMCLGLSRVVPTRYSGFGAAFSCAGAALLLLFDSSSQASLWLLVALDGSNQPFPLAHMVAGMPLVTGVVLLSGSTLLLNLVARALAPTVRGFGALFGWALFGLAATLFGLFSHGLVLLVMWGVVIFCAYGAIWASGALSHYEGLPQRIPWGLGAMLLLVGGTIALETAMITTGQGTLARPALVSIALACMIMVGAAPFASALAEIVRGPAALGGLIIGGMLPVMGLSTWLKVTSGEMMGIGEGTLLTLPLGADVSWRGAVVVIGVVGVALSSIGAVREQGLRRMVAWYAGMQAGLVLIAGSLTGESAQIAAWALLINLMMSSMGGAVAVALLEQITGNDDIAHTIMPDNPPRSSGELRMAGVVWAWSGASALGLPPWWGFWGRWSLVDMLMEQMPWVIPVVLAASVVAILGYGAAFATFWFLGSITPQSTQASPIARVWLIIAIAPLFAFGVMPEWSGMPPVDDEIRAMVIGMAVVVVAGMLWVAKARRTRPVRTDRDMGSVVLAPEGISGATTAFGALADLHHVARSGWGGLLWMSRRVQGWLSLFEGRFAVGGVLVVLMCLIFLLAS